MSKAIDNKVKLNDWVSESLLLSSDGAGSIGTLQSGTGAIQRTVKNKLNETISVFDFMTSLQIADVQAGQWGDRLSTFASVSTGRHLLRHRCTNNRHLGAWRLCQAVYAERGRAKGLVLHRCRHSWYMGFRR